jgi:lipoprotein-anchoring transpeptidase ErfK/SrfK
MEAPEPSRRRAGPGRSPLVALLAAVLPLSAVIAGLVLAVSSGTSAPPRRTLIEPVAQPAAARRTARASAGAEVVDVVRATTLYAAPRGQAIAPQPTRTQFGSPVVYLVGRSVPGWFGVVSPLAGNHRLGWIPAADVVLAHVNWSIEVSLARRELLVRHGRRVMARYRIAVGRPSAPTPTGRFAVTDLLRTGEPDGPYGCCILALSALAPHAIQDWPGGDRIAIHSTPPYTYDTIGEPVTHGCMHVTLAQGQWLLDHIPLGTPTVIRSD